MQDLKEVTHATHYENFRKQKLGGMLEQEVRTFSLFQNFTKDLSLRRIVLLQHKMINSKTMKKMLAWSLTGRELLEI